MVLGSYVIYQSEKAMEDFYTASQYANMNIDGIHYISDEDAAANLDIALLHHEAFEDLFS